MTSSIASAEQNSRDAASSDPVFAQGGSPEPGSKASLAKAKGGATPMLQQMVGTWDVQQRMWPGADAEPIDMPPAVAQRRLIEGSYLEEVMQAAQPSGESSFTRTAYISYDAVDGRYEYFSIDSRAPQQMHYKSGQRDPSAMRELKLKGGRYVAAQWGDARNIAFKYRLTVGEVVDDRQIVHLYLTPESRPGAKEFLAFEYIYSRRR